MRIITPAQCRAARGLLNWSQPDLADRCRINKQTISNFENGSGIAQKTMERIFAVFDQAGIEFHEDDGVKRRNNIITVLEGENANYRLLDDVYESLKDKGGEVLIAGLKEAGEDQSDIRDHIAKHIERLQAAKITERILVEEGDTDFVAPRNWYRWIPEERFSDTPFQLYGSKLAMIIWGPPQQIIVVDHPLIAQTFRNLFDQAWDNAALPDAGGRR